MQQHWSPVKGLSSSTSHCRGRKPPLLRHRGDREGWGPQTRARRRAPERRAHLAAAIEENVVAQVGQGSGRLQACGM